MQEQKDNQPRKDDQGKLLYCLLPVKVHEQIVQQLTYGAHKYGEPEDGTPNWRQGDGHKPHRLLNATYRHLAEYRKGNILDPENGQPHLVAAITNLVMLQDLDNLNKND